MKESYLGVNVSPLTYERILIEIQERMVRHEQSTIIAINPEKVIEANRDVNVKKLINESTFQIPDGIGVLLVSRLMGGKIRSRVTGVDLMGKLLDFAALKDYSVYFYGAKEEVVTKAIFEIQKKRPPLQIAGFTNGFEKNENEVVQRINDSGAKILFVALGSPKQEVWIKRNLLKLPNVLVFQGVGGSFDVFSGIVKRAPSTFRKLGLEWLFRLVCNPYRIKRQLNLPLFLWKVLVRKN